ncbi:MAG TPA: hypothetical protein PKW28_16960, partial [Turneriella sp.]|nr:hypothetical protein [Turneriella sp.]
EQVCIALDPAASEFYDEESKKYNLRREGKLMSGEEMVAFWKNWVIEADLLYAFARPLAATEDYWRASVFLKTYF